MGTGPALTGAMNSTQWARLETDVMHTFRVGREDWFVGAT